MRPVSQLDWDEMIDTNLGCLEVRQSGRPPYHLGR